MFNLNDINQWRQHFGVFPLEIKSNTPNQFVLLSGGQGNFCLDSVVNMDKTDYDSYSWSLNTKNYITINNNNVKIYNWLKEDIESIQKNYVENNIEKFFRYIESSSFTTSNDVVPFLINLFRKMRNLTHENDSPLEALNLLYILLLSLSTDIENLDYKYYGISEVKIPNGFDIFIEEIRSGVKKIKPDLDIILRHCSGPIFQEAHRLVEVFYSDRDLFGGISSKLITSQIDYNSTYYTPQYVARSIVEQCLKNVNLAEDKLSIFDPACGSGEFLVEILKQLQNKNYKGQIILSGWDRSECGIQTSKFLLQYAKNEFWGERLVFNLRIVEDSLIENWDDTIDIILMNPPFKAWEYLNKEEKDRAISVFPFSLVKPNLAVPFLYKALISLNNKGILGCVLPTSFFNSDSYDMIRSQMKELYSNKLVGKLGNFVFESALTDVSIYVGQRKNNFDSIPILLWCSNEKGYASKALCALRKMQSNNLKEVNEKGYSIYTPEKFPDTNNSWKIISKSDYDLKNKLERLVQIGYLMPLQSIFTVKQGIRTGDNKTFIISKQIYETLSPVEKSYYKPSIDNSAIVDGQININNYVWYPYDKKGLKIISEKELQELTPYTYKKFYNVKNKLETRKSIINPNKWWILSRHRDWLLNSDPRIVSTEFGNSKSFALDFLGNYVIERGQAWIPKKQLDYDEYYFYLALLSSSIFDKMLSIYSKQLAGGQYFDLSAKYSNKIPILSANLAKDINVFGYNTLVNLGKMISKDGVWYYQSKIDEVFESFLEVTK